MSNNKKNNTPTKLSAGLVPKLRFPEFKNYEGWEEMSLDSVGTVVASGDLDERTFSPRKTDVHIYPVYSNSVSQEGIYGYSSTFKYKSDSVTITARGTLGVAFERETDFVGIGRLLVVSELKNTNATFLKENWNHNAKIPLENGGIPQLTAVKAKSTSLLFPKLIEQQKIASCLSSLDEVITTERQKLEALKDHKKGLLQNLFPQAGSAVPKLRFKEFENSGEWEMKSIEDNIDLISGIALKSEELTDDKSGTPILRGINITEGEIRHSDEMDKYYLGAIENIEKFLVAENDVVIGMDGSKVGKNVAMVSSNDTGSILIQRVARIRAINSDIKYLYQHFLSNKFRNYVDVVNTSSGIPHISAKQIRDFEIGFPPNIKEQQKIASCLSSLDDLIIAQNQKIETLQQHKKGLLQGLFPNVNTPNLGELESGSNSTPLKF